MSTELTQPDWKTNIDVRNARGHLAYAKEQAMKAGAKILEVLKEVHDLKSYRFDYDSWEDYCNKVWKMSKQRAHQIITGANFMALLNDAGGGDITPLLSESHIRNIKDVSPKKIIKAARAIVKSGDKLTSQRLVKEINPEVLPPTTCKCPTCGGSGKVKKVDEDEMP